MDITAAEYAACMMNVKHYSRLATIIIPDSVSGPFNSSQSLFMNPRQKNIFTI
jgi:hypothetical protein